MRLTVGDFASPAREGQTNPCVMGCAHLYLGSLFVFGEGLGGSEGGRVEGRLAVSAVLANFRSADVDDPHERLGAALAHAADVLRSRSRSVSAFTDAWAQAVAVLVRKNRLYAVRCGDVRLMLVRRGEVRDLFAGSSKPKTTDEAKAEAPSLLGQGDEPRIEVLPGEIVLEPGDRFLLANAPLASSVPEKEVARYVSSFVPAVAARRLVEAVDRAQQDRPVSVQIVQSGDAPAREIVVDEPIRPRLEPASGVSALLARSQRPAASKERRPGVPAWAGTPRAPEPARPAPAPSPVMELGPRQDGPRWAWFGGMALVGLLAFGLSSLLSSGEPIVSAKAVTQDSNSKPALVTRDAMPSFWARVSTDSIPSAARIREWAGDDADRRLAEARAVVAALENAPESPAEVAETEPTPDPEIGLPDDAPFEDVERGEPSEAAAPGSEAPPSEPPVEPTEAVEPTPAEPVEVVEPDPAPAVEAPAATWDPASLPRAMRPLERIFSIRSATRAGETLRNYIHRRHTRVDSVLARLDAYLALAPRERSVAVLEGALRAKPGPKTRRWLRKALKGLQR